MPISDSENKYLVTPIQNFNRPNQLLQLFAKKLEPEVVEVANNEFKLPSHLKPKVGLGKKAS